MRRKKINRANMIAACLVCAIYFSFLGNVKSYASEPVTANNTLVMERVAVSNAQQYQEQAQRIYDRIKERIDGTEPYIETGIYVSKGEFDTLSYYTQIYFLGERPQLYYQELAPDLYSILVGRNGLKEQLRQHEKALEQLKEIIKKADSLKTKDEKAVFYAKYLYGNYAYDYSYENKDVYKLLRDKKGICHTYATAYAWLCKLSDIPVIYMSGSLDGVPHAWDKVKRDGGDWKNIDVTNLHVSPDYTYVGDEFYRKRFAESNGYLVSRRYY